MMATSNGSQRPLGLPTVKDRVLQTALSQLLMQTWKADFHPLSFAFLHKWRAHQAINEIPSAAQQRYIEFIGSDLSLDLYTIPLRKVLKQVARRVSDRSVVLLIKSWLRAPIVEEDRYGKRAVSPNVHGTPQGGVISPLLAKLDPNPPVERVS